MPNGNENHFPQGQMGTNPLMAMLGQALGRAKGVGGRVGQGVGNALGRMGGLMGTLPGSFNPQSPQRNEEQLWKQIGDFPQASRAKVEKAVVAVNKAMDKGIEEAAAEYRIQKALLIGPEIQAFSMFLAKVGLDTRQLEGMSSPAPMEGRASSQGMLGSLGSGQGSVDWRRPPGAVPSEGMEETIRRPLPPPAKSPQPMGKYLQGLSQQGSSSLPSAKSLGTWWKGEKPEGTTPRLEDWWRGKKPEGASPAEGMEETTTRVEPIPGKEPIGENKRVQIETYARELLDKNPDMGYEAFEKRMREKFGKNMDLVFMP